MDSEGALTPMNVQGEWEMDTDAYGLTVLRIRYK